MLYTFFTPYYTYTCIILHSRLFHVYSVFSAGKPGKWSLHKGGDNFRTRHYPPWRQSSRTLIMFECYCYCHHNYYWYCKITSRTVTKRLVWKNINSFSLDLFVFSPSKVTNKSHWKMQSSRSAACIWFFAKTIKFWVLNLPTTLFSAADSEHPAKEESTQLQSRLSQEPWIKRH